MCCAAFATDIQKTKLRYLRNGVFRNRNFAIFAIHLVNLQFRAFSEGPSLYILTYHCYNLDGKLDLILQRLPRASPVLHIEENTLNAPLLDVQQKATMKEYQSKRKIQFRNQKDIIEEKD